MDKKKIDILLKHSDEYIAYIGDRFNVLASGKTIKEVETELKKKKILEAVITYIPPLGKSFSPYASN